MAIRPRPPLHLFLTLLVLLFPAAHSAAYTYSSCNSTAVLNPANLACTGCPSNQVPNLYQSIATSCQCSPGYSLPTNPNAAACSPAFTTACATPNSYYPVYGLGGSAASPANCLACSSVAFANRYFWSEAATDRPAATADQE